MWWFSGKGERLGWENIVLEGRRMGEIVPGLTAFLVWRAWGKLCIWGTPTLNCHSTTVP